MNEHAHDNEAREIEAAERGGLDALSDRLMEEINILRLEGALFCFDPKEARRHSVARVDGVGALSPTRVPGHAMRT